jgi:hypothetical protein
VASPHPRGAEIQTIFRRGNEVIRDATADRVPESQPVRFLCECADERCQGRVEVTRAEWQAVASEPNWFLIIAGHARSEGQQIVGSVGAYEVVQTPEDAA